MVNSGEGMVRSREGVINRGEPVCCNTSLKGLLFADLSVEAAVKGTLRVNNVWGGDTRWRKNISVDEQG